MEGYIQFLIRTEEEYRDLLEAAIYAQYPEAEITEVEDYVGNIPHKYPDDKYEIFGFEFILEAANVYPIRTYQEFEHSISKDVVFNDPLAAILENFSRIGAGENFWIQIIVEPSTSTTWKEEGIKEAKKIIADQGEKPKTETIISKIGDIPRKVAQEVMNAWDGTWEQSETADKDSPRPATMMDLTPGLRNTIEALEEKISKNGFETKIRALYAARKEVFNPNKCVSGYIGAMKQFFNSNRNGFRPTGFTKANYAFKKMRTKAIKNNFMYAFKKRKPKRGVSPFILNTEELATIWHFPLAFVKTPLIQKTASKKAEPPIGLPLESIMDLPVNEEEVGQTPTSDRLITDASGEIKTESDYLPDSAKEEDSLELKTDKSKFDQNLPYG